MQAESGSDAQDLREIRRHMVSDTVFIGLWIAYIVLSRLAIRWCNKVERGCR